MMRLWLALPLVAATLFGAACAEDAPPTITPVPQACLAPGVDAGSSSNFPNVVEAMKSRHRITVLAVGASSVGGRKGVRGAYYGLVEAFLERTFKGLDVVIVQRGVSGELARDVAERIRLETARIQPDVVFWQVGTADAFAGIDPSEVAATLRETIGWLRDRRVDTVLIGLHYSKSLARDPYYQAVRKAVAEVARTENVLKISRYEVMETLSKVQKDAGSTETDVETTANSYDCMAEYLARSLALGLYGRDKGGRTPGSQPH